MTESNKFDIENISDEELAKVVRNTFDFIKHGKHNGIKTLAGTIAAMYLIDMNLSFNSQMTKVNLGDFIIGNKHYGNWNVYVFSSDYVKPVIEENDNVKIVLEGQIDSWLYKFILKFFHKIKMINVYIKE